MSPPEWHPASFRDPSGHIFKVGDEVFRAVAEGYAPDYRRLNDSGLYGKLTADGKLVRHDEFADDALAPGAAWVLRPEVVPFISYPWEWSFSQLKDAALLTLDVAWSALDHGMVLKDASAFNIQFFGTRPVLIDTLSFEEYVEGQPWVAYRQFCQHFLAPLVLRARVHPGLASLSREHLDGVPLDLAAALLPRGTLLKPSLLIHIHGHARAQSKYADSAGSARTARVGKRQLYALLDSLRSAVSSLSWEPKGTEWAEYYDETNYASCSMSCKEALVARFIEKVAPSCAWDLGANTGRFSRLAEVTGAYTVALDIDPAAVEKAYRDARVARSERLLPLVMDLMNPTPALGWALAERDSILGRGLPDLAMALALVHHLAIAQNVPLPRLAEFFAGVAPWLVIEFVPKEDSQVQRMLATRRDIFTDYDREGFEAAFSSHFSFEAIEPVEECERTLYLMRRRDV